VQGPRHDHEVGLAVEDIVNNLQAMELAMIYADPDVMAATTSRCLHHGRPDKYFPLSLDPACPRAGELARCLGCITLDVRAEVAHPALKRGMVEAKRNLKGMGLTRSFPYSMGWDGKLHHHAPGGWDSLAPARAPAPAPSVSSDVEDNQDRYGDVDLLDPHYDGDGGYDSDPWTANLRALGRGEDWGWGDDD